MAFCWIPVSTTLQCLVIVFVFDASSGVSVDQNKNYATGCFGVDSCSMLNLTCRESQRIKLASFQNDFYKGQGLCQSGCMPDNASFCTRNYSKRHVYELYTPCSGKRSCQPRANHGVVNNCNGQDSQHHVTIVSRVEYKCTDDEDVINVCDDDTKTGSSINLIFDGQKENGDSHDRKTCSCEIDTENVYVVLEDIRLQRPGTKAGSRLGCSSVNVNNYLHCNNTQKAFENFEFRKNVTLRREMKLQNLYGSGKDDRPAMVWVSVHGTGGKTVTVRCNNRSFTPTTESSEAPQAGSPSVVSIVIPIVVVLILGAAAVVGFVFWRKRRGHDTSSHSTQNMNGCTKQVDTQNSMTRLPNQYIDFEADPYAVIDPTTMLPSSNAGTDDNDGYVTPEDVVGADDSEYNKINLINKAVSLDSNYSRLPGSHGDCDPAAESDYSHTTGHTDTHPPQNDSSSDYSHLNSSAVSKGSVGTTGQSSPRLINTGTIGDDHTTYNHVNLKATETPTSACSQYSHVAKPPARSESRDPQMEPNEASTDDNTAGHDYFILSNVNHTYST